MRILLLSQYFPPEFGAAAARNSEHARFWAESGHDVEVLTAFPNYPAGVVPREYQGRAWMRERRDGYRVCRAWIHATPNRAVWRRALASVSFMASAVIVGALACRRPDVIVASSGPFFVAPLGWLLSLIKRAPFVFEVRDVLPQQAVDVGMLRNPLLIRILEMTEAFLYRRAARVVCVAAASRDTLLGRGLAPERVHTIENGIREELFVPGEKENGVRAEYGWRGKYVALYMGAHGVSQGLGTLLACAENLQDDPDFVLALVGDGADKPMLERAAAERGLRNVVFLPLQDKSRVPEFYAAADVCFVPLKKGKYFETNIPSKMFEIMACARPIVLGARGQARELLQQAGAGLAVDPEDADGHVAAIKRLRREPDLAARFGESGRRFVLENFTRRQKAAAYLQVLAEITGKDA